MHENYDVYVTRVIDGDTIVGDVAAHVLGLDFILRDQYFRLEGINAPEKTGATKELGLESKAYLESLILNKTVQVDVHGKEKYGRWLAVVYLENLDINTHLVLKGFAETRDY